MVFNAGELSLIEYPFYIYILNIIILSILEYIYTLYIKNI